MILTPRPAATAQRLLLTLIVVVVVVVVVVIAAAGGIASLSSLGQTQHDSTGATQRRPPPAVALFGAASPRATAPAAGELAAAPTSPPRAEPYSTGLAASSVGQIRSSRHSCTATVVNSSSGQVAVTAAHCVYTPPGPSHLGLPLGWIRELEFVPGRSGDREPFGIWAIERMWVSQQWQQTGDARYDVAFLRLAPRNGLTAQHVLGAEGLTFTAAHPTSVAALGYPVDAPYDGRSLRRCSGPAAVAGPLFQISSCPMTGGSSGGPWLTHFDPITGMGTVEAVTSLINPTDGLLFGAPLTTATTQLYDLANRGA